MENESIIRPVRDLLNKKFYVPKYQRGYRWKEKQVEDLLNDIDKFTPSNCKGKNSWYCLQPLVVKKKMTNDGERYRLIDGQQRLTTIKLILYYVNTLWTNKKPIYFIDYQTRGKDEDWITVLGREDRAASNIDFLYIFKAYNVIAAWFTCQEKKTGWDIYKFHSKLSSDCKFIWYDIDQNGQNTDTEEAVFIRLNDGKIPLTNSELIKALFLNSSNFAKDNNEEEIRLRQLEVSTQWDIIEQELSDDEFWHFINGKENTVSPRIEYLFDIIVNKPENNMDKDFTFRHFARKFEGNEHENEDKICFVNKEWESILNTYLILKEWFKDKERRYYHPIGYLLCMKYSVSKLLSDYKENDKDTFSTTLTEKIKEVLKWDGDERKAQHGGNARNLICRILLLHNVVTMQKQENEMSRFSFFHYIKTEKKGFDIEHIHASATEPPEDEQHRKDWLNGKKNMIVNSHVFVSDPELKREAEELTRRIEVYLNGASDSTFFDPLFEDINQHFEDASDLNDENLNYLSNLALLDLGTNRGYGNDYFFEKRETILKRDKEGVFIPVCTKKVFLKYYTKETPNMTFWGPDDRKAYLKDICTTLSEYLIKEQS